MYRITIGRFLLGDFDLPYFSVATCVAPVLLRASNSHGEITPARRP